MAKAKKKAVVVDEANITSDVKICKHYMDQCMTIKKEIFDIMASMHANLNSRKEQYLQEAKEIKSELLEVIHEATQFKKNLAMVIIKAKEQVHEEVSQLTEQRKQEAEDFELLLERMGELENYIKNERFHDLVNEINELENKFEQEAVELVQRRMKHR